MSKKEKPDIMLNSEGLPCKHTIEDCIKCLNIPRKDGIVCNPHFNYRDQKEENKGYDN